MRGVGIEPTQALSHKHLKLARLAAPALPHQKLLRFPIPSATEFLELARVKSFIIFIMPPKTKSSLSSFPAVLGYCLLP